MMPMRSEAHLRKGRRRSKSATVNVNRIARTETTSYACYGDSGRDHLHIRPACSPCLVVRLRVENVVAVAREIVATLAEHCPTPVLRTGDIDPKLERFTS